MGLLEIILIAVALAMDAFAVSVMLGLSVKKLNLRELVIPGVYFGFFQFLMPLAGYFAGAYFVNKIQDLDHWIAFVLLGFIGGKMVRDSFSKEGAGAAPDKNPFSFVKMLVLAVATSIDAFAAGITFAFLKVRVYTAVVITGVVTFFVSIAGVAVGSVFGVKLKSKAEFIGGVVLIMIGIKIVIEHIFPA
ncbi:MAG: manganese efflux pump MntP family protein [Spirochaetaceae bacterium]|jgi:putative Mn2+ efflux pump MntP|nr:manganese efflux pump MntP family protein [Spirochaetaceae bacterium]